MAWSKDKAVNVTMQLLKNNGIELQDDEAEKFHNYGYARICGFNCRVANVIGTDSFRVRVCSEWFQGKSSAKPSINTSPIKFDYQLFPTKKYLFVIYYLALRDYALQLEKDKSKWFQEPYWGMLVNEETGLFTWKGGNTLKFPLLVFSSPLDLELRAKQYHAQLRS